MRRIVETFVACSFFLWVAGCGSESRQPVQVEPAVKPAAATPVVHEKAPAVAAEHEPARLAHPASSVAVLDLDKVAQRIGRLDEINMSIKEKQAELNDRLELLRRSYQFELDDKKSEFGSQISEEQKQQLLVIQQRMNAGVAQARQQAQQELQLHQNALKTQFHEQVRPIARRVAEDAGMSVIITNNFIFASTNTVDITDQVVEQMMQRLTSTIQPVTHTAELTPDQLNGESADASAESSSGEDYVPPADVDEQSLPSDAELP